MFVRGCLNAVCFLTIVSLVIVKKENGKGDYDPKVWCVALHKSIYVLVQAER